MNQVYLLLLSTLGSGHTPGKKLPDGCSVLQVSDSEWLTTACDNPDAADHYADGEPADRGNGA